MSRPNPRNHAHILRQLMHGSLAECLRLFEHERSVALEEAIGFLQAACIRIDRHVQRKEVA